ncbi:MAG: T9SS type A sorting domain-containing protein [Melioribacter sp.]|nr:T9SS type A sorting domain-containing protein [Melioribacter sp.]
MKMINRSILIFLALTLTVLAQQQIIIQQEHEKISSEETYPIDARPYLERFNKANGIDEVKLAKEQSLNKVNKTAWNFSVGSKGPYSSGWWAADLRTGASPSFYIVPSTCRAVGVNCYIFVEDSSWVDINNKVNQTVVDSIQFAFDYRTPANPSKGVYQTDVDAFGNVPNVDNDSKIIILLLNIRDGYKGNGGYVAGFFHSINEINTTYSNMAEIYYLDCNPLPFLKQDGTINNSGLTTGMKTTAHEFQHMIHWNYFRSGAETFFNEGWSLAAEVINGYSLYNQSYFLGESNHYLLDWRYGDNTAVLRDYSRAARFSLYLKEQFGSGIFKSYLNNRINGVAGLNYYWSSIGSSRNFFSVLIDWWLANFLNENVSSTHPEWVYTYTPITKVNPYITYSNPNVINGTTDGLYKYSAEYITFNSGKNLKINFNTSVDGYIQIKAIKVNGANKIIEDVIPGVDYYVPDYSSVTFMVYHNNGNDSQTAPFIYSFNSSGITGVNESIELLPLSFSLDQNYPNPFNPSTEIKYQLPAGSMVSLKIYDMLGREVATLVNEFQQHGQYVKTFQGKSLPSGVYLYRLIAGNKVETKKMILMK